MPFVRGLSTVYLLMSPIDQTSSGKFNFFWAEMLLLDISIWVGIRQLNLQAYKVIYMPWRLADTRCVVTVWHGLLLMLPFPLNWYVWITVWGWNDFQKCTCEVSSMQKPESTWWCSDVRPVRSVSKLRGRITIEPLVSLSLFSCLANHMSMYCWFFEPKSSSDHTSKWLATRSRVILVTWDLTPQAWRLVLSLSVYTMANVRNVMKECGSRRKSTLKTSQNRITVSRS